jgi:hypothetical protein
VVSQHFFPGVGFPTIENIPTQHVPMVSDINFNAVSTLLSRKIAEKVKKNLLIRAQFKKKVLGTYRLGKGE